MIPSYFLDYANLKTSIFVHCKKNHNWRFDNDNGIGTNSLAGYSDLLSL